MGGNVENMVVKTLAEEATELIQKYDIQQKEVSAKIEVLAEYMANTRLLADHKDEIYSYRQKLVMMKLEHMTTSNSWNRRYIKAKSDTFYAFKLGKKQIAPHASIAENYQLLPKNEFERALLVDSSMRGMQYINQLVENQMEFIKDSLSNVINMGYGIEYVIKLEEHRSL